jgi:hypothetical protein
MFCRADGTCSSNEADAANSIDANRVDAASSCQLQRDDSISAGEYPIVVGNRARFRIATNATISSAGTTEPNNRRRWQFAGALSGDSDNEIELLTPQGAWWSSKFPTATYGAKLSSTSDLIGVFAASTSAISLLGVVSPTDGLTRTEIKYQSAIDVMRFPLINGETWSIQSSVSGLLNGVITAYSENYTFTADAQGTVETPYGAFPVLRLRTELTQTVGLLVTKRRTFGFIAECFGNVASMVSKDNPAAGELTSAAELRRLIP